MSHDAIRYRASNNAQLMNEAGQAIDTIAKLIEENLCRKCSQGEEPFLRDFEMSGLACALKVIATHIWEIGDETKTFLEKEAQQ